jgi:tetratricopeptide (TPR) repeat protein
MLRSSRVALVVGLLLMAGMLSVFPLQDFDIWMHLAAGRYIVEHGHLPAAHPFNFTAPPGEWIDQEWLSQTLLFLLYQRIGTNGLVLLSALTGAIAVGLTLWLTLRRGDTASRDRLPARSSDLAEPSASGGPPGPSGGRGADFPVAIALALLVILFLRPYLTPRPQLVTLLLLALWAFLLGSRGQWRPTPYVLAGTMLLWANLHAGFLAGLILLGLYWLEALWRWGRSAMAERPPRAREAWRLGLLLFVCLLATMVNPYGWRLWTYPVTLVTMRIYMQYIEEWMRPDLSPRFWLLYGYLVLGSILLVRSRRSLRPVDGLIWAVFGLLALSARRHIALFAVVSSPAVAVALSKFSLSQRPAEAGGPADRPAEAERLTVPAFPAWVSAPAYAAVAVLLVALGLGIMLAACPNPLQPGLQPRLYPAGAAQFLREHSEELPRQLYNSYVWGGYLEWELWPQWSVFIDGECVVFRERIFRDWDTVYLLEPGWPEVLGSYGVNCIIRDWGLDDPDALLGTGEWLTVYWDDVAMVVVRRAAVSPEFLSSHDFSLTNPAWLLRHLPEDEATSEQALGQLTEAARRFGPSGIGHHLRGALLYQRGRYEEALGEFRADAAMVPEQARSWSAAGDCWRRLGRYEEAAGAYRQALQRNSGLIYTRIHLASIYERQGKRSAAFGELRRVEEMPFDDPYLREQLRAKMAELQGQSR